MWVAGRVTGRHTDRMIGEAPFDQVVVPHIAAARRLARWLMGDEHDADDLVQEASLRALRYFGTFTGGDGRAWFLRIVRNTHRSRRARQAEARIESFDERLHPGRWPTRDPEAQALQRDDALLIEQAMRQVPDRGRELLLLREVEGLSYRELADSLDMPLGTVMSGLSRARRVFRDALDRERARTRHGCPSG
jgi:RNA polymerase sigma factor (sigma-70 family)